MKNRVSTYSLALLLSHPIVHTTRSQESRSLNQAFTVDRFFKNLSIRI
ncbi:hypothetical protein M8998_06800 [Sphingobacterium sp. lm-10]|nr:hypothetical protein [Sphingobacterium sp. lm-10]MCL7987642.1 hypothetical protein [Sphingobacterium sp. lm-10]